MAFFTHLQQKPQIDFRVNGETTFTAFSSNGVVNHATKTAQTGRASFQALAGLTTIEYIALPANAKVSVNFYAPQSQQNINFESKQGEGFL